jgi:hypothetical protein
MLLIKHLKNGINKMATLKQKIALCFLLIASIVTAQTPQSPKDSLRERQELMALMQKYPDRSVFFPEEFGEQLTDAPKEELLRRLQQPKDSIEMRKIAQVLGDREMAGTLKLTPDETVIVDNRVRAYILQKADFYGHHPEVDDQILRFWDLAIPEMLRNLENPNLDIQGFVFNTLVRMRSERLVRIMINKARACKDPHLRRMYVGTLGIMMQQQETDLPNRQCMDQKSSQALFDKLIAPALKELSPPEEGTGKN